MKKDLIVKDNALINASYHLSLVEQRLVLLAIIAIRNDSHDHGLDYSLSKPIKVTASSYISNFNVDPSTAYKGLKEACKTLFARQFSYQETKEGKEVTNVTSRWIQKIAYTDQTATIEFLFANDVIPLITNLEKYLTSYELKQISNLTSSYAIRIYELIIAWRSTGKTPMIKIEEFREKIGILNSEYTRMDNLKRIILEPAIKQINKHTDIKVTYEQHKEGRSIVAFSFKFRQKKVENQTKKLNKNTSASFYNLTESQLDLFSKKLSQLPEIQVIANVGEKMPEFIARIREMLKNPTSQEKLKPFLDQLDFKAQ